ncbi:MAG: S26 family signal peptidase, partial [Bryocella sp.]
MSTVHPGLRDAFHSLVLHAQALCEILVVAIFAISFILQPFRIPSASMQPTLRVGDFLLGNKQAYAPHGPFDLLAPTRIHRGDLVIFRFPPD